MVLISYVVFSCGLKPGKLDKELFRANAMKVNRDLLVVSLSFYAANSADTELDMTNLQADAQPLFGIWDNPHFLVINKGIFGREIRLDLIK
jgi:hypothetical protein